MRIKIILFLVISIISSYSYAGFFGSVFLQTSKSESKPCKDARFSRNGIIDWESTFILCSKIAGNPHDYASFLEYALMAAIMTGRYDYVDDNIGLFVSQRGIGHVVYFLMGVSNLRPDFETKIANGEIVMKNWPSKEIEMIRYSSKMESQERARKNEMICHGARSLADNDIMNCHNNYKICVSEAERDWSGNALHMHKKICFENSKHCRECF
jgi:hypothetical protein